MIDIKDKSGNIIFSTPINVGSKKKFTLMKEDYITLKFSVKDPILFSLGDGISYDDIGDYELVSPYKPTYNTSTGGYDYELQLDAYYRKWKNKILKYSTSNKGGETSFSLTATIDIHLNVILRSIASYGYNYRGTAFTYQVDSSALDKSSEAMLVEYDSTNIIEALNKLCAEDKWNCEWWVTGSVIHVGKCENGTSVNLELGKNIEKMERSDSKTEYATRYFVFGGTTNVPETYRKSLIFKVTKLNGMGVLDENRTLRASYFQDSDKLTNTYHTSALDDSHAGEYISTSEAEYTKDISVGTLDAGTYAVNLSSLILKASETLGTTIDLYFKGSFTCEVNLVCDGIDKKVFFGTMNVTDRDNMSMTVEHTENIALTSSANAVLRIKMSIGYNYSTKNPITFTIKGGESITSVGKGAKCTLTFLSGTLKGQTVQGVYNSNYEVESSNQYITLTSQAAVGDTFTIDNILKPMVPSSYFTADDDQVVKDGVVTKRLMLPLATPYIDSVPGLNEEQLVEKVLVLDDVYPRMHDEKLTDVKSEICDETDDKGNKTGKTFPQYTITDDKITTFKPSYIQSGKTLGITFMTGLLSGMTFDAKLLSGADKPLQITIIRNNNYGRYLPDEVIKPAVGDEYVLTNYNVEFMSTTLVSDAETELYAKAKEKIAKLSIDGSTYTTSMMSDNAKTLYDAGTKTILPIGQKVKLINPGFFSAGRDSRVLGYELSLDIPFDTPQFTIGETYEYSRLSSMEEKIESMTYKGSTYSNVTVIGGSGSTYLITKDDETSPSDSNTFSSLRVLKEISDRGHTHTNKAVLDNLTQAVIDNSHTHTNKATLDVIDQSLSTVSSVKFAKVTATDAELGTIKATTADFSGALKAAAATVIGLITCATLNADAATIPNITATNINASTQVVSPLFVGHLQGNADTATRLKDTFKLWGQDFYGNNVSGAISGATTIDASGQITALGYRGRYLYGDTDTGSFIGDAVFAYGDPYRGATVHAYGSNPIYFYTGGIKMILAPSGNLGIGTTSPSYKLDVNGSMRVGDSAIFDGNLGTSSYISQSQGWRVTNAGNADFRTIYTDELHATAFTADVSQALAGSDYLTKSVSKLSANFVVPAVGSSVRIIVDDLEGMPATACFENGDYIRFRAFNKTSGLTISDVWGTVQLDTTFGTNGFSNGTQAYIYTVTSAAVTGLTVYKGSEVLDYGKSSDGLIVRTTLDKNNSPYSQIATWVNDPSNSANYTVHARLGNLNGIANCNGYGLYTDNAYLTNQIVVGDLTKANNYLSYNPADGLVVKGNLYVSSGAVASTADVNTAKSSAIDTASSDATNKANSALTSAKSYADSGDSNTLTSAKSYTATQFSVADGKITAAITTTKTYADNAVNNIQVGGRNLVLNSNRYVESTGGNKNIDFGLNYSSWRNNTITISIEVELKDAVVNRVGFEPAIIYSDNSMQYLSLWIYGDSTAVNRAKQRIFATFKIQDKEITDFAQKGIYIQTLTSGYAFVGYPKIELGNKPTDWSPAPEDVDASIATKVATTTYDAKMTWIDSQFISKVSNTDFNALGQRVSSTESSITQLPSTIDARITTQVQAGGSIYSAVATSLTMTSDGISLFGKNIQLSGAVTFVSSLNQTAQGYANTAQSNAISTAATDAANKADAVKTFTETIIDATALDVNTYYPVTFYLPTENRATITVSRPLNAQYEVPSYSKHNNGFTLCCRWSSNGSGWGALEVTRIIENISWLYVDDCPIGSIWQITQSSEEFFYIRGGSKYNVRIEFGNGFGYSSDSFKLQTSTYNGKFNTASISPLSSIETPVVTVDAKCATSQTSAQNNLAVKIGYASYDDMVAKATAGNTIINGAYIRTTLIESVAVLTNGLVAHKINADDIDTTSITSSTAFVNSLTANTAFISNLKTNIVNAAYVNTLSLDAAAIKAGTIDTARMNASDIVTKGLQAKTIDAMNATIQNITVTNATISGTLNGCTGIFSGNLSGVKGTIGGWTIQDGGLYNSVSGTGFIKLEVNGGRQLSINSSADSPVLAIRSDSKPALRIYTQDYGGAGIDITAQTTSWAITSHGKVQLVSRNTEGTFINMLCKCQVVVTSSGTIGSTICWVDPVDNLQFMPNRILCMNTSDITIYLPDTANIKDGYEIEFRHLWSNYVTIRSYNGLANIILNNKWYDTKTKERTLDGSYIARYTWCASRAFWVEEYHL